MLSDTSSYINPQTTWSTKKYYEVGLISFILGLTNNLYLFKNIRELGAVFAVPYLIINLLLGIPLVILELSLSQYGQKDMIQIWEVCPVLKGLGYICLVYTFIILSECIVGLAFLARYIINSFSTQTGWDTCNNDWNTEFCITLETNISRRLDCYDKYISNKYICDNATWESSYSQYWYLSVHKIEFGFFQWKMVIYCLGVASIAFVVSCKGIRVIERVIFWFLILAAINFTILLYCSFIQDGSSLGLSNFFLWDWSICFKDKTPWVIAIKHVITSTSLGAGGLRTLGSQNKFRGHSYMNGMMIILVDTTVTILYMLLYFSLCGNLSYFSNEPIEKVLKDGEPEMWSKIPRMLEHLDGPTRFWQGMFYLKVFLILLSKTVTVMFVALKTIFNTFPRTEDYFMSTSFLLYLSAFICCIPIFSTYSSFFWEQVIGHSVNGPVILAMNFLQVATIIYCYGLTTVVDDIHFMLGFRIPFHWQIILFFSPMILFTLWILYLCYYHEIQEQFVDINVTRLIILNSVAYLPIFATLGYAAWYVRWMCWTCQWENVFRPTDSWYLSDPILRKSRQMFSAMSMTKEYLYRQTKRQEKEAYEVEEDGRYVDID